MKNRWEELLAAHREEMNEPASEGQAIFLVSRDQVQKARVRYATLCAEYAACAGICASYRAAGLENLARPFQTGALTARESARAVAEILDILGLDHIKASK